MIIVCSAGDKRVTSGLRRAVAEKCALLWCYAASSGQDGTDKLSRTVGKKWPLPVTQCRSQWPRGVRGRIVVARLLRFWVRIPPGAWMSVSCECCVLSGRSLCDGPITRPEESYRLWCVVVCDLETPWMRRPWPTGGCCVRNKQKLLT